MLLLSSDGIFPIIKDRNGNKIKDCPHSGLPLAGTVQGEGKLAGLPSLFVRLGGCNLRCCWKNEAGHAILCDSAYASWQLQGTQYMSVEDVYATIMQNCGNIRHIVLTGGEPFLQAEDLKSLCYLLKQKPSFHLTIETNATLFDKDLAQYIDLFSLSPKLSTSHQSTATPVYHIESIRQFIAYARKGNKDFQLKFVYSADSDIDEIQHILSQLDGWKNEDILLMPLGGTQEILQEHEKKALEHCIRNGWRFCDRLHIRLFGDKQGV